MPAPRSLGSFARRASLATAAVGLAGLALAPGAVASGYNDVTPPPTTSSLPPTPAPPSTSTSVSVNASRNSSATSLAYTGAEVVTAGTVGAALVVGGVLLVRGGRRRGTTPA